MTQYIPVVIDHEKCTKCLVCVEKCPTDTLSEKNDRIIVANDAYFRCIRCKYCLEVCPVDAVKIISVLDLWDQ